MRRKAFRSLNFIYGALLRQQNEHKLSIPAVTIGNIFLLFCRALELKKIVIFFVVWWNRARIEEWEKIFRFQGHLMLILLSLHSRNSINELMVYYFHLFRFPCSFPTFIVIRFHLARQLRDETLFCKIYKEFFLFFDSANEFGWSHSLINEPLSRHFYYFLTNNPKNSFLLIRSLKYLIWKQCALNMLWDSPN